jgi:hypothetical protein
VSYRVYNYNSPATLALSTAATNVTYFPTIWPEKNGITSFSKGELGIGVGVGVVVPVSYASGIPSFLGLVVI